MKDPNTEKLYPQAVNEEWMAAVYKAGKPVNNTYVHDGNQFLEWVDDPFSMEKASDPDAIYCWVSPMGNIYVFKAEGDAVPMYLPSSKNKNKDIMVKTMVDMLSRAQMAFGRRNWRVLTQVEVLDPVDCQVTAYTDITKSVLKMLGIESTAKLGWQEGVKGMRNIWF